MKWRWGKGTLTAFAGTWLAMSLPVGAQAAGDDRECDLTTTGQIPLPDGGGRYYRRMAPGVAPEYSETPEGSGWHRVGLYGNGRTTRPIEHEQAGIALAQQIAPVDGNVVMLSIGMSNTNQEFVHFETRAGADPAVNQDLVIVNSAQGGAAADDWADPAAAPWLAVHAQLQQAGLSTDQVQIAWIKNALITLRNPPWSFPEHPQLLQNYLEDMARALKINFPNVVVAFVSGRTRAYITGETVAASPEPHAYENSFAVQWMIERQLAGDAGLRFDGANPPAPWLAWGPYLWTDGTGAPEGQAPDPWAARSDGFVWNCDDVERDGMHPAPEPGQWQAGRDGEFKVGDQLMAFFLTDPVATPWFLNSTSGGPVLVSLTANGRSMLAGGGISGTVPFTVELAVSATGQVAGTSWTYDDGTASFTPNGSGGGPLPFDEHTNPTKIFRTPGTYDVRVAVRDTAGNTTLANFPVIVTDYSPVPALGAVAGALLAAMLVVTGCASPKLRGRARASKLP